MSDRDTFLAAAKLAGYPDEKVIEQFMTAGSGQQGSFDCANSSNVYEAEDGEYAYALYIKNDDDDGSFTSLEDDGEAVASRILDFCGAGYATGAVLTGRFTKVEPASGTTVGLFIKRA